MITFSSAQISQCLQDNCSTQIAACQSDSNCVSSLQAVQACGGTVACFQQSVKKDAITTALVSCVAQC